MDWSQSQIKLFRALLYCFPAEFRHEYGAEMRQLFSGRLHAEPHWRLWLDTLSDIALTAPREHAAILAADLKHELRALRALPGFTFIVLLVTALGIGSAVAVFSVVNAVLLRPLPYSHPETLVYLFTPNVNFKGVPNELPPPVPDVFDWRRSSKTIASIALFSPKSVHLIHGNNSSALGAAAVSADFFLTLGVHPHLGRALNAADDQPGHERVAVVSYEFWLSHSHRDPAVIGSQIQLDRKLYTVVGVMPPDFGYPFDGDIPHDSTGFKQTDVWLPLALTPAQQTDRQNFSADTNAIARLRTSVTAAAAQTELRAIETRLNQLYPAWLRGWTVLVQPLSQTILSPVQKMLWLLIGFVTIVLLIAVSNVSGLLLARTASRAHELGIRTALGAERARIVRQLLTESLLLSCLGGLGGIAIAYALVRLLIALSPGGIPRFEFAIVDLHALFCALTLSTCAGVASGVIPALLASRADSRRLISLGRTRTATSLHRGPATLVILEVALSVLLLMGSGLLVRGYLRLQAVDAGFSQSTLTFRLNFDETYPDPRSRTLFDKTLLTKLRAAPSITSAGAATAIPLLNESATQVELEGHGVLPRMIDNIGVTCDYHKALGTPLLCGRGFIPSDANTHSVLISNSFARTYLSGRDPIGVHIRMGLGLNIPNNNPWLTIIGVVGDVHHAGIDQQSTPAFYQPIEAGDGFAIRSSLPARQAAAQVRAILRSLDPALSADIKTMRERVVENNAGRTFQTALLSGFAILAVVFALIGLYGLMSYNVKQRTPEIAIRLAIGSPRGRLLSLIMAQGLRLTLAGLAAGLAASFALTRVISSWLFETRPTDALTFTLVPLSILAVAAAACFFPAWSASRTDPMQTLRRE